MDGWQTIMAALGVASLCGTAAQLRKEGAVIWREVFVATLYSGCLGLVIALLWFNYFNPTHSYFLIGVAGLSGLGGMTAADRWVRLLSKVMKMHIESEHGLKHEDAAKESDK